MVATNTKSRLRLLLAGLLAVAAAQAEVNDPGDVILPADPRFDVFELTNSVGDHSYASPVGTVLYSFASEDARYCRAARFPSGRNIVLACREERGWKIEAVRQLVQREATNFAAFGSTAPEVNNVVSDLNPAGILLGAMEVVEAAQRGWRNPPPYDAQAIDARGILKRSASVYRSARSYVDTATVERIYITPKFERVGRTQVKTAYVPPFDFRFESVMDDFGSFEVHFIAWRDQDNVELWYNINRDPDQEVASIETALDTGAAISSDASGMIPGLFFPGMKLGGDIVKLGNPTRIEDAQVGGFDCFQVQGIRWPHKGPTVVSIDKRSFLIRRVYEEDEVKGATTKTTWSYEPGINVPVAAEALLFDKPGK